MQEREDFAIDDKADEFFDEHGIDLDSYIR